MARKNEKKHKKINLNNDKILIKNFIWNTNEMIKNSDVALHVCHIPTLKNLDIFLLPGLRPQVYPTFSIFG